MGMEAIAAALAALLAGAAALTGWLLWDRRRLGERAAEAQRRAGEAESEAGRLAERLASQEQLAREREQSLVREREALEARFAQLNEHTRGVFEQVAGETLDRSTRRFLELATQSLGAQRKEGEAALEQRKRAVEELVGPIDRTLRETRERLTKLDERITESRDASRAVHEEASKLVRALSRPDVRGKYGEIQLRRVAELAGMTPYCDFSEQHTVRDEDGAALRPDMVVLLPNERRIAVDAKTPTDAYMQAIDAPTPEAAEALLERFASGVWEQVRKLSDKRYWAQFEGSPEFVVMFVPGDQFVDAALARRPELLEKAAEANVILASPSTLIGLLRAVAVGWREHKVAEEAHELFRLGRELHERVQKVFEHAGKLGDSLQRAVHGYNEMVGSIEHRLTPTLRKFEGAGAMGSKPVPQLELIDVAPRELRAGTEDGA
ncbi:MAG: DNA recombination protein RmuC [Phycisphaerales bacterium JB039]